MSFCPELSDKQIKINLAKYVQTIQSNTNKYAILRIQTKGTASVPELFLAMHAYANFDSKMKRFVLRKKCREHVNERSHLPHTGLLMQWSEVCWLWLWIQGCRYRSAVVFQSKQQGIWGETEENRRGGFVHILTPFSSHLEEMLRYKWPAWSLLREDCIFLQS